jgi:uncharacterized protein YeaO (DUF488 family)
MIPTIYTGYFANIKKYPKNVCTVSISRYTPRWYSGLIYKGVSPSTDLVLKYKSGRITKPKYTQQYIAEVFPTFNSPHIHLNNICQLCKDCKVVILCCYEKPSDFCHRHICAKMLNHFIKVQKLHIPKIEEYII